MDFFTLINIFFFWFSVDYFSKPLFILLHAGKKKKYVRGLMKMFIKIFRIKVVILEKYLYGVSVYFLLHVRDREFTIKQGKLLISSGLIHVLKRLVLRNSILLVYFWMNLSHQWIKKNPFLWSKFPYDVCSSQL